MDVGEIRDEESLEAWLKTLPAQIGEDEARRWAVQIAHRAAMRALPRVWGWWLRELKPHLASVITLVLRLNLTSAVAGAYPNRSIVTASKAALATTGSVFSAEMAQAIHRAPDEFTSPIDSAIDSVLTATSNIAHFALGAVQRSVSMEHVVRDCVLLADGVDLSAFPLWHSGRFASEDWSNIREATQAHDEGWRFWIDWYDKALNGEEQDWDLLTKVALIPSEDWDKGADHVNAVIAEIVRDHEPSANAAHDLAESIKADKLIRAAIGDFTFDALGQVMRLVPFADDIEYMRDPEALKRVQDDIGALRDQMETFARAMGAEKSVQGAGPIAEYLQATLGEFDRAKDTGELRVGNIIEYGGILQFYSLNEATRTELGPLGVALSRHVSTLLEVTHRHFASTFLRFASLRELELEPDLDAHSLLSEVRDGIRALKQARAEDMVPLARQDWAVLDAMADNVDRLIRAQFLATDEGVRTSFQRDINFHLAQLQVSLALYGIEARQAAKTVETISNAMVRFNRGVGALGKLWEAIKPYIWPS